jgi:hypothetical protein
MRPATLTSKGCLDRIAGPPRMQQARVWAEPTAPGRAIRGGAARRSLLEHKEAAW